jgi:hypothetical protein
LTAAKGGLTGLSPLPENGDPNVKGGASRRRQTIAGSPVTLDGGEPFRIIQLSGQARILTFS